MIGGWTPTQARIRRPKARRESTSPTNKIEMSQASPPWDVQTARRAYARVQKALTAFVSAAATPPVWEGKKTVVYGAGCFGRDVARALQKQNVTVLGFLDQKGTGQIVLGDLRSYAPASEQAKRWLAEKPVALIGVHNFSVSVRDIAKLLTGIGFG